MNKKQYLKVLEKMNLSQVGAGRLLGISDRQAQRLASGDSAISGPIERALALMAFLKYSEKDLAVVLETFEREIKKWKL